MLTFFVNQFTQTLSCPLNFCSYASKRCRTVKPVATHFSKCHPYHQLCVSFHCQWCNAYIDPAEMCEHARVHLEQDLYHRPFSPPTPTINPTDNSFNFVRTCNSPEYAAVHQCQNDVCILVKDTQLTSSTFCSNSSSPYSQDLQLIHDTCDTTKSSPTLESTPLSGLIPSRPTPELLDPPQCQASEPDSLESTDSCNALAIPSLPTPELCVPSQAHNLSLSIASNDSAYDTHIPSPPPAPVLLEPSTSPPISPKSFNPSPDLFPSCDSPPDLPPRSNHPSEPSSASPILPISPRMPDFLDPTLSQLDCTPSGHTVVTNSNVPSPERSPTQQPSPPLSLSPSDSPSKFRELFCDQLQPKLTKSPTSRTVHSHCSVAVPDTRIVSTVHLAGRDLPSNDLRHVIKATRKNARVITCTNSPPKPSLPPRSPECIVLDEIEDPGLKRDRENREEALRVLRSVFHKAESLAMSPTSSSSPTGSLDDLIKLRGSTNSSSPLNSPPGPSVIPPSESPRVDDVIAPPPPVTRLLHPTCKSDQANLSQVIADALKVARSSPK